MDAVSWLDDKRRGRIFQIALIVLAIQPTVTAIVGRLLQGKHWLGDYEAVLCGARSVGAGVSPYTPNDLCSDMQAADFVYSPQIAEMLMHPLALLGVDGMRWLYAALLIPATLLLLWYAVLKPFAHLPLSLRLIGLMAIRGSPLATGNLGGLLQGMMLWAGLNIARLRWLFIAVVILAGCVKPAFLTTLVVLLCERRPLKDRMITFAVAIGLGLAAVGAIFLTAGPIMGEWRALVDDVLQRQPGRGYIALLHVLGLEAGHPLGVLLYVPLAAALIVAAIILADIGKLGDAERVLLGFGMAQMLNPRLYEYDYDMYLLYPALALIVMMAREVDRRLFVWTSWAFVTVMVGNFLISVIGINVVKYFPGTWLTGCAVIGATVWAMVKGKTPMAVLRHSLNPGQSSR